MKRIHIAEVIASVALIACGAGACGSGEPTTPPRTSQAPVESPTQPGEPKSQEPVQTSDPEPQDAETDNRPLPEECRHPAGGSVRESCIEEFGPDGVGTVSPVPSERDRNNNGIDDSVEGTESPQDEGTEPPQDEGTEPPQDEGTEPPQDEGTESPQDEGTESPQDEGTESPQDEGTEPSQDEEQVPPKEEQIKQCTEQTGLPEACREKIDP
ncbi:hypothetical protein E1293_25950 [Actinomadura darangshiensis]|uniref:Uncharacterized protein n=1 Tax=Actinomadura darangshiensis TaxID=705336 RepID=A0A4R5AZN8_9ACTN|nr:hypothetical protein [Actinomadura darangshiensis]TDD77699.1 hypothetical protein E1293_25950 [Actinomadura darangshiensis]